MCCIAHGYASMEFPIEGCTAVREECSHAVQKSLQPCSCVASKQRLQIQQQAELMRTRAGEACSLVGRSSPDRQAPWIRPVHGRQLSRVAQFHCQRSVREGSTRGPTEQQAASRENKFNLGVVGRAASILNKIELNDVHMKISLWVQSRNTRPKWMAG